MENIPSPSRAALASFLAFAMEALLPLLAGGFIHAWWVRIVVVCGVSNLALVGFGAASAVLGHASVVKITVRVLVGEWMAMVFTYDSNQNQDLSSLQITIKPLDNGPTNPNPSHDSRRAQWLRAAILGSIDGIVSVASIMIGVGAANASTKAMLVSGLAGLVAGACSMAIGELVSVYAQYDTEVAQMGRRKRESGEEPGDEEMGNLPSPARAALASFLAFAIGALLPLLAGGFIHARWVRIVVVCGVSSLALVGFGAASAVLGDAHVVKSTLRVLIGGWLAMLFTYGVVKAFDR
ncbi:vacuolar iron transporter 2-like protein [Cinnamomum micranthum f. kanehirae]|uniref:Vacuolar iron transporter n=1 Tax=Cinnamomum micranthum f. kanehirae TaxID=337451 RepID=A0A3S4PAF5_9MAGN|nr:vacuolar iron transporter 2-like protein [Cinnamomum micranthum f. kanehirae]